MEQLIPKQPFYERYEFLASLSQADVVVDGLQVVVQYHLLKQGEIRTQVLGNSTTFDKLAKISNIDGPPLTLRSSNNSWEFRSDSFHLGSAQRRSGSPDHEKMTFVVCELELPYFETIHHYEHRDLPFRQLTFYLAGPEYMWEVLRVGDLSYTG